MWKTWCTRPYNSTPWQGPRGWPIAKGKLAWPHSALGTRWNCTSNYPTLKRGVCERTCALFLKAGGKTRTENCSASCPLLSRDGSPEQQNLKYFYRNNSKSSRRPPTVELNSTQKGSSRTQRATHACKAPKISCKASKIS